MIVYNHYVSPLVQRVTEQEVLPISEEVLAREHEDEDEHDRALLGDFIYEPEPEQILERLLPSTSRRSSTAPCSSRPPPSTARG